MGVDKLEAMHALRAGNGWRYVFLVGVVPAVMVVLSGRKLREPAAGSS